MFPRTLCLDVLPAILTELQCLPAAAPLPRLYGHHFWLPTVLLAAARPETDGIHKERKKCWGLKYSEGVIPSLISQSSRLCFTCAFSKATLSLLLGRADRHLSCSQQTPRHGTSRNTSNSPFPSPSSSRFVFCFLGGGVGRCNHGPCGSSLPDSLAD